MITSQTGTPTCIREVHLQCATEFIHHEQPLQKTGYNCQQLEGYYFTLLAAHVDKFYSQVTQSDKTQPHITIAPQNLTGLGTEAMEKLTASHQYMLRQYNSHLDDRQSKIT